MNRPGSACRLAVALALTISGAALAATPEAAASPSPDQAPRCEVSVASGRAATGVVALTATTSSVAAGVEFFLDGRQLGFGFTHDADSGTSFSYAAFGTLDTGWSTNSVSNGRHDLTCRGWNVAGLGQTGPTTRVSVHNNSHATLTAPEDQSEVSGMVPLKAVFTGHDLPTTATFKLDDGVLGTGTCHANNGHKTTCTYTWNTPKTTADIDWEVAMGLRVISAQAVVNSTTVSTQPVRTFVNNRPGTELILSAYEKAGLGRVGRDGGWSSPLPGNPDEEMVTFGDGVYRPITGPQKAEATIGRFGNTNVVTRAGMGLYGDFHEVPNPTNDPYNAPAVSPVVPIPGVMKQPDGSDCDAEHSISWSTGLVPKPHSNHLLMTYWSICSQDGGWPHLQAYGVADWDPATNTSVQHNVFTETPDLPSQMQLASPSVEGNYMYFWRPDNYALYLARVRIAGPGVEADPWNDPAAYEYRQSNAPGGWTSNPLDAENVLPQAERGGSPSSMLRATNLPGKPWLLISQPDVWHTGMVDVYVADKPGDPWRPVPEWQGLTPCPACGDNGIYSVYSHPERSTAHTMTITFSDRTSGRVLQQEWTVPKSLR